MRSPPIATAPSSRHYSLACPVGALRLCPLAPAEPSHHPPAQAISSSPLCATIPAAASSPVHATSHPFPAPGTYKRATLSSPIPHTSLGHPLPPSPCPIEPAPLHPSPTPVSLALLPLLSSSLIHTILELRNSLTNTMHPSPPPIALGSLAGDLTAASARHRTMDRPPQAPSGQIGPTPIIHYPTRASPPLLRRKIGLSMENRREPHRQSSRPVRPPSVARSTPLPPSSRRRVGPHPRRSPALLRSSVGRLGRLPAPRVRVPALAGPKSPPAQLAENSFSFSFFQFFFPFSYIYLYTDILCTKK
jgi:hypothetical protein